MKIINGVKVYTKAEIDKVTADLEKHGARCTVYVISHPVKDDMLWELDHIRATFPDNKKWDIVEVEE